MRDGKLKIRYFVSYAHDDKDLKKKLLQPLKQLLDVAKYYDFEAWDDGEILAGEDWHERIQEAVGRCQFGLLLVSPAFLGSKYIKDHELPAFVVSNLAVPESEKRAIPIALKRLHENMDLKGLEKLQIFYDSTGRTFQERSTRPQAREEFALELFQQIFKIVKRYGTPRPIPNQVPILWFNDDPRETEPYKDAAESYSITNVTTVTEANFHLDHHLYNLLILDVRIPTWTEKEEKEYPPHLTDQGRTLGLQFYIRNKDKLENKGIQVLVITKAEELQDRFIQAGLPREQFCTAFSVRLIDKFMKKVNETLSRSQWFRERSQWFREKTEDALLQLSSNDKKEIGAALLNLQTLALPESLYSKVHDKVQELTQHEDNPRIKQLAISTLNFINQTKRPKILRVILAFPGDVQPERDILPGVIDELNRGLGAVLNVDLKLYRWETDAYPGFHPEGPQNLIDPILRINECDILIGIFWKRFGTPTKDASSGTEHEFQTAYEAWKRNGRPQIMVYFKAAPYSPNSREEIDQWGKVADFKAAFPEEVLWWPFINTDEFENLVRKHMSGWLRDNFKT